MQGNYIVGRYLMIMIKPRPIYNIYQFPLKHIHGGYSFHQFVLHMF